VRLAGWRKRESQRAVVSGLVAMNAQDYERAEMLFRLAVECYPKHFGAWVNLGNAAGNRGRHRDALRYYHHAHTLAPFDPAPRVNIAHAHLQLGEYRDGWSIYEERWHDPTFHARTSIAVAAGTELAKRWDGAVHRDRSLLIFAEQGAGDVLMMLRYWGLLEQTGMHVIYRVPANLWRLVRYNVPKGADVVTDTEPVPRHDYHAAFMSLPYLFRTWRAADIPGSAGYLHARPHPEVASLPGYRVGLVWKGNRAHKGDAMRSIHNSDQLAPLFETAGVTWVSLQLGEANGMKQFETLDFYETSTVVRSLHAVVSVDTSTAHIAGALCVPTLLMIGAPNDYRWMASGDRTPWYFNTTLFRCERPHAWPKVIESVRSELTRLVDQRRAA